MNVKNLLLGLLFLLFISSCEPAYKPPIPEPFERCKGELDYKECWVIEECMEMCKDYVWKDKIIECEERFYIRYWECYAEKHGIRK